MIRATHQHPAEPDVGAATDEVVEEQFSMADLDELVHEALAQYETYAKIVARNERAVLARMIGDATHRRLRQEYVTGYSLVL